MKTVAFHTLGCKVNQYETEAMEELFENRGYSIKDISEKADIYVINTCTVTNVSDRKSRQFIRKSKKKNTDAIIAVVGCYSQVSPEEVEEIQDVDIIVGTSERNRIVDLCEEFIENPNRINIVKNIKTNKEFEDININEIKSKTRAYVKIQDGCNQFCSYCIIPYARGTIRSRAKENIINEAKRLAKAGFKELVLTGIHLASYGKDLKNEDLLEVIKELTEIDEIERIRLSSVEPSLIDKEFLETAIESKKVCDHFHLSLQSGSDTVLKRMNRKYSSDYFRSRVNLIRKYMPNAGITTDIIVGFPGETEEEFKATYEFVKEIGFSKIHVFKYSKRQGTPAYDYENHLDSNIKNRRSASLIALGDQLAEEFLKKYIGLKLDVLYEEEYNKDNGEFQGYTTNYIRVRGKAPYDVNRKIITTELLDNNNDILVGRVL